MGYSLNDILSKLRIVPTKSLVQHEQRIERNLLRLKEAMLNIGQIVDPIIIDKKTNIVLDGNHRMRVLELIKVPNAICQVVNYKDSSIKVGGWYPANKDIPLSAFDGFKTESVDLDVGKQAITKMKAVFLLRNKSGNYLIEPGNYDLDSLIDAQQKILKQIQTQIPLDYLEDEPLDKISNNADLPTDFLARKPYTKDEIIKRALSRKPFPPKSTRHYVPNRIIRLNMRLGWLHQDRDEAWSYLRRLLKNRVYSGNVRRYVEPVIVIY